MLKTFPSTLYDVNEEDVGGSSIVPALHTCFDDGRALAASLLLLLGYAFLLGKLENVVAAEEEDWTARGRVSALLRGLRETAAQCSKWLCGVR